LFRAICPYNYTTKENVTLEKSEFKSNALVEFADSNQDGFISLYEFYFFVAFLQTPLKDFEEFFKGEKGIKQ